jgi:hypothetical protein
MIEMVGDLWTQSDADAICITTNGYIRKDGSAAMGRGCAKQAREKIKGIEFKLGRALKTFGNKVAYLGKYNGQVILSFPVKNHFNDHAEIDIIAKSANELKYIADNHEFKKIMLPRPGCGYGHLSWTEVRQVLRSILDDRFYSVHPGKQLQQRKEK